MTPMIEVPYQKLQTLAHAPALRPWLVALILALILCFQIGLVLWVFFNHPAG